MSYTSPHHIFLRLLQPSWYGGLLTLLFSIAVVATLVVPSFYKGSLADIYFETASSQSGIFTDYDRLSQGIESSNAVGNAAVFVAWALVGLAVYYVVLSLVKAASDSIHFIQLVEYFKVGRRRIVAETLIRLLVRLGAIAGLYIVYKLSIGTLIPYILYFTHKALYVSVLQATLYLVFAFLLLALTVHALIVLVRLLLLRYRIIKNSDNISYN